MFHVLHYNIFYLGTSAQIVDQSSKEIPQQKQKQFSVLAPQNLSQILLLNDKSIVYKSKDIILHIINAFNPAFIIVLMNQGYQVGQYIVTQTQLGRGSYGSVYKGELASDRNKKFAVKIASYATKGPIKMQRLQTQLMKALQHQNIVRLYEVKSVISKSKIISSNTKIENSQKTPLDYYIFMQYCQSDLKKERKNKKQPFSEDEVVKIFKQICNGYKVLYQNKIVHRDIKPQNILIHNGVYKIADFGFGRKVDDMQLMKTMTELGSLYYMSPQLLGQDEKKKKYSSKCDIWSLGVLIYQLLYQKFPYNFKQTKQFVDVFKKKLQIPNNPLTSPDIRNLLGKMLRIQEKDRIDWIDIFLDKLIKDDKELSQKHSKATKQIQSFIDRDLLICQFISILGDLLKSESCLIQNQVGNISTFIIIYYVYYFCHSLQKFFYDPVPFYAQISEQDWKLFKETNTYWILLKKIKKQQVQNEQFMIGLLKQIKHNPGNQIMKEVDCLISQQKEKQFDEKTYIRILQWSIDKLESKKEELDNLSLIQNLQICKNPHKYFLEKNIDIYQYNQKLSQNGGMM